MSCAESAREFTLRKVAEFEQQAMSLGLMRSVDATETSSWLWDIADSLRQSCSVPLSDKRPRRKKTNWDPYCQPFMVALRERKGECVCIDLDCSLSGGYAHVGPCEPCSCGALHAVEECPANNKER